MFDYIKNISTLSGGTLLSQIILLISVPFLTRIFTPTELGVSAFFLAISTILSCFSTGKYDLAFFKPQNHIWVQNLFFGTILINFSLTFFLLLLSIPTFYFSQYYLEFNYNYTWFILTPILFLLNGLNTSFISLLNKKKLYTYISIGRILRNLVLAVLTILLGIIYMDPIYIIVSHIISMLILNSFSLYVLIKNKIFSFNFFNYKRIVILVKKFKNFPLYTLPASFLNILSNQMPIIMLTTYFGSATSGVFSLVNRTMGMPSKLISSATAEVFRQKATEEYSIKKNCKSIYLSTFKILFLISLFPFTITFFYGPSIFSFIFGPEWMQAGVFAQYLSVFYMLRFSISPLGFTLIIANRQDYNFYWQLILLILLNLGLFIGYYYDSVNYSIIIFSILYSVMYLFYFRESYRSSLGFKE